MLRSLAISRIKRGLDFRVGSTDDDNLVLQLQESQRLLEKGKDLPRFLIEEDATLVATSGDAEIALPERFLRELEESEFQYYDSEVAEWVTLEKVSINEGRTRFADASSGKPQAYTLRKATIVFWPERDTDYTMTWSYYKAADLLDSDIENAWLEHNPEALIGHAGMRYAADLGNEAARLRFEAMYTEAWSGQFAEDVERDRDNDPIYMGGRL